MAKKTIATVPADVLRRPADPILAATARIAQYLQDLGETLEKQRKPAGVGLALPQIGHSWRAFATLLEDSQSETPQLKFYINPEILDHSDTLSLGPDKKNPDLEGCLSIPLLYAPVFRPEWVRLQWQEIASQGDQMQLGQPQQAVFYDFSARVIQHELDHLNGVLFTDYLREQNQPLYRSEGKDLVETDPIVIEAWSRNE